LSRGAKHETAEVNRPLARAAQGEDASRTEAGSPQRRDPLREAEAEGGNVKPGVYPDLSMAEYLSLPAVSASLLRAILDECPRAAWHASWLNENPAPADDSDASDRGSVAHQILLEGSFDCCCVIDPREHPAEKTGAIPAGWTNKSIRAARDEARAAGKIPILAPDMAEIHLMVGAARAYVASLERSEPAVWQAFAPAGGESELTVVWDDGGTLCRIRPDRISADHRLIVNYKTTGTSVEPDRWGRTQFPDYYLGAAFYRRGVEEVFGVQPDHVFLCQENRAPYLCSLVGVDPATFSLGDAKVNTALLMWRACAKANRWPAYPPRVCYPTLPPWEATRWEEREIELSGVDYERGLASQP
jgi:hypothetical protein